MKIKQLILLLVVVVALSVLVYYKKNDRTRQSPAPITAGWKLPEIAKEQVTEISVSVPGRQPAAAKKISLLKDTQGVWRIPAQFNARVATEKVDELLTALSALTGELRSESADVLADYGLTDAQAIDLVVRGHDKEISRVLLGVKRAGMDGNFVRQPGKNAVFLVEKNILANLGFWAEVSADIFTADPWLDKTVVRADPAKITDVTIVADGQPQLKLLRKKENDTVTWNFSRDYPMAIDVKKVEHFLQTLSSLQATEIISPESATAAKAGAWVATLTLEDGTALSVRRGPKDPAGTSYFLAGSDVEYGYSVSTWYVDELNKTDGDFFADNPLAVSVEAVTAVEIEQADQPGVLVLARQPAIGTEAAAGTGVSWRRADGQEVAAENVTNFLQRLSQLRLLTVDDVPAQTGVQLRVAFGDDITRTQLLIGEEMNSSAGKCHRLEKIGMERVFCIRAEDMKLLLEAVPGLSVGAADSNGNPVEGSVK